MGEATVLKERTKELFNELNKEFRNHNTSFAEKTKKQLKIQKTIKYGYAGQVKYRRSVSRNLC